LKYADDRAIRGKSRRAQIIVAAAIVCALTMAALFWQRTDLTPRGSAESSKEEQSPTLASSISGLIFSPNPGQNSKSFANTSNLPAPKNMTLVSGGAFMMGRDESSAEGADVGEQPAHKSTLKPFLMDIYEVTNQDYAAYLKATGRKAPANWNKQTKSYEPGKDLYPVTGINWVEANAYCQNYKKRLPTEAEWEFAARGNDSRLYPWGNEWQDGMANANNVNNSSTEVGKYSIGSPFGTYDMVGNAWEWTSSVMKPYPNGKMPANQPSGKLRVIRGGTYDSDKQFATATYRTGWPEKGASTYAQTSFRCVQDVKN
jgi:iron(II)-dependent oxidoreductase